MRKQDTLQLWRNLPEGQNPLMHMRAIPYKAEGSKYGTCGVRIDGNPRFVDAVLSCLKAMLDGENRVTRLELSRHPVKPVFDKHFDYAEEDAEVCYIRLHVRGHQSAVFGGNMSDATDRFAKAIGA